MSSGPTSTLNLYKSDQDRNQSYDRIRDAFKNRADKFEDWEFPITADSIGEIDALKANPDLNIIWKRPHELVNLQAFDPDQPSKPVFMDSKGFCRFDVNQGGLGDCWYLASLASLTTQKELFDVVVPRQNRDGFDPGEYSGAFYFRFWRAGVWLEIVIDDRLPCFEDEAGNICLLFTGAKNNEFWPALAEKAFAKMYGSYAQIEGGFPHESLEDFTGGVSELVLIHPVVPKDFKSVLKKAVERRSFIGLGSVGEPETDEEESDELEETDQDPDELEEISGEDPDELEETSGEDPDELEETSGEDPDEECPEVLYGDGIVPGHAYSVLDVVEVMDSKEDYHLLIKLRNPWGMAEWTGKWNDNDEESWESLSTDLRLTNNTEVDDDFGDGEFWMSYEDVIRRFDQVYLCHWTREVFGGYLHDGGTLRKDGTISKSWDYSINYGEWTSDIQGDPETLADLENFPAYVTEFHPCDHNETVEEDSCCLMVVALMYKHYNQSGPSEFNPRFGFRIFKIDQRHETSFNAAFYESAEEVTQAQALPTNEEMREINERFSVSYGRYCIVPILYVEPVPDGSPTTTLPFLLRIFTEKL